MTAPTTITPDQRRELEAIYRQHIGAIKALARLLGYPCPIASRAERRTIAQDLDDCGIVESIITYPSQR